MARRRSSAASRPVQAGEVSYTSRALALPRVAALSALYHEQDALGFVRGRALSSLPFGVSISRRLPTAKRILSRRSRAWSALSMLSPRRVLFCLRRKIRKEVLFAIRKSGRNGGRVYRRRQESQYAC